jgi:predicted acetyltransferase
VALDAVGQPNLLSAGEPVAERDRLLNVVGVVAEGLWMSGLEYRGRMPELVLPTTRLHAAFLECHHEWGPGLHEDGFGIGPDDDVDSPEGFAAWVHRRTRLAHPAGTPCPAERHGSPRWIVEDGQVLGGIVLRHIFDDDLGHIGYGVRPSARRRGLASWALGEMLNEARAVLGLDRVLIPCLADNIASARTIERNGGALEGIRDSEHGPVRRYWIALER